MTTKTKVNRVVRLYEAPLKVAGSPESVARGGDPRDQGKSRSLVSRELTGSEDLLVGIWYMQPGQVHLLHHHPNATEVYYVLSGSATFTVGNETVFGMPGTCMYIPAGTPHKIEMPGDEPLVLFCIFNKPDFKECGCIWLE